jgi:flagellar FliJ protein
MKKFRFPLRSVSTVRNLLELRAREQFSRTVHACGILEQQLQTRGTRLAELEEIIRTDRLRHFRAADQASFLAAFRDETAQTAALAGEVDKARATMEQARQAWLVSRRDVRVVEKLEQKARAAHRLESERENQAALDDRATALAVRGALTPS